MLPSGFEPESPDRESEVLGRIVRILKSTTLWERNKLEFQLIFKG